MPASDRKRNDLVVWSCRSFGCYKGPRGYTLQSQQVATTHAAQDDARGLTNPEPSELQTLMPTLEDHTAVQATGDVGGMQDSGEDDFEPEDYLMDNLVGIQDVLDQEDGYSSDEELINHPVDVEEEPGHGSDDDQEPLDDQVQLGDDNQARPKDHGQDESQVYERLHEALEDFDFSNLDDIEFPNLDPRPEAFDDRPYVRNAYIEAFISVASSRRCAVTFPASNSPVSTKDCPGLLYSEKVLASHVIKRTPVKIRALHRILLRPGKWDQLQHWRKDGDEPGPAPPLKATSYDAFVDPT
ncbi:hypothetical protein CONPUDRAFT_159506 [Coniophora puteana RWD-64-598 SS2]|uniref:Uncharacterized protein n=1 Tax=Coniophora puteana (strain RWD-64-598) TaxID=741705 RepID=A0A5M3M8Y0_CONPW|nr:uncharacterized protein CONPUDRAFT_159506 [Coniophora puteana RWD-64-598 SS2]EIW75386.1 hypothetical protein CONPUDRAFT_159506 [Coniophora puteana RWD-64-598 SS2]